jgi:hypothetical protein
MLQLEDMSDKKIKWFGFIPESLAAKLGSRSYGQKSEETLSAFTAWMVLTPEQRQRWRDLAQLARLRSERTGTDFMDELRRLGDELGVKPNEVATPPGASSPPDAPLLPPPLAAQVAKEVAKVRGPSSTLPKLPKPPHRRTA